MVKDALTRFLAASDSQHLTVLAETTIKKKLVQAAQIFKEVDDYIQLMEEVLPESAVKGAEVLALSYFAAIHKHFFRTDDAPIKFKEGLGDDVELELNPPELKQKIAGRRPRLVEAEDPETQVELQEEPEDDTRYGETDPNEEIGGSRPEVRTQASPTIARKPVAARRVDGPATVARTAVSTTTRPKAATGHTASSGNGNVQCSDKLKCGWKGKEDDCPTTMRGDVVVLRCPNCGAKI